MNHLRTSAGGRPAGGRGRPGRGMALARMPAAAPPPGAHPAPGVAAARWGATVGATGPPTSSSEEGTSIAPAAPAAAAPAAARAAWRARRWARFSVWREAMAGGGRGRRQASGLE